MGGGIGIMNGASCRIVTERTTMAMPEIGIGLFPDVGGSYFLNRMPEGVGMFFGLTSARFNGADAVAIGMADLLIRAERKRAILDRLGPICHGPVKWPRTTKHCATICASSRTPSSRTNPRS